ncbi:MAG: tetratricopeptide repeat protein [Alphaproteobacteria bacterium]|nr:tetratricopeptide repeat protein [Alphaproteobacteria bacterium]
MTSNAPNRYFFLTGVATIALLTGSCSNSVFEAENAKKGGITSQMRSTKALISMGDTTLRGGDVTSALRFYEAAVKSAPNDPVPLFRLGRALQAMGAHKAAAEHFRKVLAMQPGDGEAKRQLANTLIAMDNPQGSIRLFQEVIAESGDYRAFNGLGVALDMTGKHKDALAAYRAGLAKQPKSLTLKNNLALSMAIAGQYANAAKVLRNVTSHPHATARHRQNLALVYGLAGEETQAARVARVDLDGPSVKRNLDYYNWLRRQPRWMVQKLLRNGAPIKPQAASAARTGDAAPKPAVSPITSAAPRKTRRAAPRTAARKPVHATPRITPRRPEPKRESVAAPRQVDHEGVIRQASLAGDGQPPVRFARLEFGFRPVKDAEKPETTEKRESARRVTTLARINAGRYPTVVRPAIPAVTPLPVVVRGNGETPETATASAAAKAAATTASVAPLATRELAKEATKEPVKDAMVMPEMKVIHTQLALAGSAHPIEAAALRKIEANFQRSGLEHLMGDADKTKE